MTGSLLRSFVSGTRQIITAQLFISIGAIALAGWTLGVTNELIRERDRLRERVIQLEQTMGGSGIVVPDTPAVVEEPTTVPDASAYPGEIGLTDAPVAGDATKPEIDVITRAPPESGLDQATAPVAPPQAAEQRDFGAMIGSLFAPPPPIGVVVLHIRAESDTIHAQRIARELQQSANVRVVIDVMAPRDQRQSGYAYFDGRQSRASAALVTQFHDIARRQEIAPWSAQLRGIALPAQGEYTPDRLDIVLPPLPEPAQRVDPRLLVRPPG